MLTYLLTSLLIYFIIFFVSKQLLIYFGGVKYEKFFLFYFNIDIFSVDTFL